MGRFGFGRRSVGADRGSWKVPERTLTPSLHLEVGDRVNHDKYGLGTVVASDGAGARATVTIDFGSAGTVRLMLIGSVPGRGMVGVDVCAAAAAPWPEPAPEVVVAVRAAYRRREPPLPVVVRDRLGELFPDAEFAAGFGMRGARRVAGRVGAGHGVAVAENLTDRQAG